MITITKKNLNEVDFDTIEVDPFWNIGDQKEHLMHRIHAYPAKFPAFITTKTIEYAKKSGYAIHRIADIFCGCGTVAFEAKTNGIDFWGCDINPVAILIAKVKSHGRYQIAHLEDYFEKIISVFSNLNKTACTPYSAANERITYWFDEEHYYDLARLKIAIESVTPAQGIYRLFFYCAFSNILKPTSRWLTKSIKPQIDPNKIAADVLTAFQAQVKFMIMACQAIPSQRFRKTNIVCMNFLDNEQKVPKADMIITSPPYVTSYEYADLHQLSSLWLGYAQDYRTLRNGSIGSVSKDYPFKERLRWLNETGRSIVESLMVNIPEKARDVAKYYFDMQQVARRSFHMLPSKGMAVFVIGNTEYKGVHINNAKHLVESFQNAGFSEVNVTKRKISMKILTPYRDTKGHFSSDANGRKVYSEEFIIIGKKTNE